VLAATPPRMGALLARAAVASGHLNLELHGIDALDGSDGVPAALVAVQPGLRTPASEKLRRLREVLAALRQRAAIATLESCAERFLPAH
jgi:peptidoglycan-N-acetylglucosamine deacetylase